MKEVAAVILAGGEGSRIGGGKPIRMLGGERLIDRALRLANSWAATVALAVRCGEQVGAVDAPLLFDDASIEGPVAGLVQALRFARDSGCSLTLVFPADMPFLPPDLLECLSAAIGLRGCAMASSGGRDHPVCALWRVSALEFVESYLESGRRSLRGFAEDVGCVRVNWPGGAADPFFNVNTAADLARAEGRAAAP